MGLFRQQTHLGHNRNLENGILGLTSDSHGLQIPFLYPQFDTVLVCLFKDDLVLKLSSVLYRLVHGLNLHSFPQSRLFPRLLDQRDGRNDFSVKFG